MFWIILWILLFLFLVLIHELGHFVAAKKTGVQVLEFGMGIPPKICTLWTDRSGTEYTLNAIPLWWFVRLKGEDPSDEGTFKAKDSFIMASFWSKTIILVAWVAVNFFFAWAVLTMLFRRGISPIMIIPENASTSVIKSYLIPTASFLMEQWLINNDMTGNQVMVSMVEPSGLWFMMGLQSGDIIMSVNTISVNSLTFKKQLQSSIGQNITFDIIRWWKDTILTGTCPETDCLLWVYLDDINAVDLHVRYQFSFLIASRIALTELYYQGQMTLSKLGSLGASLFSWSAKTIKSEVSGLSGPIWAVKFGDMLVKEWLWSQFLAFAAMISFALALFNLLPIPALDGGRWLWVIIQSIFFPHKIEKYFVIEGYINFVFFVILMALGVYIMLKDLVTAWGFHIPFIG